MGTGDHLREVDENRLLVHVDHDVEFVEIAVNDAVVGQLHQQVHQFVVQRCSIFQFSYLASFFLD